MTWRGLSSPPARNSWPTVKNVQVAGAKDVDDFLAAVPPDKRAALLRLRRTIKAEAATELINYGVPMFRLYGKNLVSYAADLKEYKVGKGSIQFAPQKPLPAALVTKLVRARIAENGKGR
jgi:uncharacterized protein YdhG (YjbR/CyaY superfamily)